MRTSSLGRSALIALATACLGAARAPAAPLPPFPDFDEARAQPMLVVAELRPGGDLENPVEACRPEALERPRAPGTFVICLHQAYRLRATLRDTVYGRATPAHFDLAMTSHYNAYEYADDSGPYLTLVGRDGDSMVMATYANGRVYQDRLGDWILPLTNDGPAWLPCATRALIQPLSALDFPSRTWRDMALSKEGGGWHSVEREPARFTVAGDHAWPRLGLSVRRLSAFLATSGPAYRQMFCEDNAP